MSMNEFWDRFFDYADRHLNEKEKEYLFKSFHPTNHGKNLDLFDKINLGQLDGSLVLRLYHSSGSNDEEKRSTVRSDEKLVKEAIGKLSSEDKAHWAGIEFDNDKQDGNKSKGNVCRWNLKNDVGENASWDNISSDKIIDIVCQRVIEFFRLLKEAGIEFEPRTQQSGRKSVKPAKEVSTSSSANTGKKEESPCEKSDNDDLREQWKRALEYQNDVNRKFQLKDKDGKVIGNIIDDAYLDCEKPIIDEYNSHTVTKRGRISTNARILTCGLFELGLQGDIDQALVLQCNINSGFGIKGRPNDIDAYENKKIRSIIQKIRMGGFPSEPHLALLKEVREMSPEEASPFPNGNSFPIAGWFREKLLMGNDFIRLVDLVKDLRDSSETDDEILDWLAYHFASRELVFYHTKGTAGNADEVVSAWEAACQAILHKRFSPHQEIVIEDVKTAINQGIPIISRRPVDWIKFVPELKDYNLYFCYSSHSVGKNGKKWSGQTVTINSNNLLLYDDVKDIPKFSRDDEGRRAQDQAKEKAWKAFTKAVRERFKELHLK